MAPPRPGAVRGAMVALAVVLVTSLVVAAAVGTGVLRVNEPSPLRYPVRGVDVSHHQGVIDWPVLAGQGLSFAFVKATEGSSHVDPRFAANLDGAQAAGLRVGAYHFFSFDSPGADQAANVAATVPTRPGMLPVAVDLEFYGSYWSRPAPVAKVRSELTALIEQLAAHYGTRPILYTTAEAYNRYVAGAFDGVEVWIRDVWRQPALSDGRAWTFWQYSDRQRLPGYAGTEPSIDLNVYAGSRADWNGYRP